MLMQPGINQTTKAKMFWRSQMTEEGMPVLETYCGSRPLPRYITTTNLTFACIALPAKHSFIPTTKELLQEDISVHMCDRRSNKTYRQNMLPGYYRFEEGFTEHIEPYVSASTPIRLL